MRSISIKLFLIAGALQLSSCGSGLHVTQALQTELPPVHLAYKVERIEVIDSREFSSPHEILLPVVSMPGQYIKHAPALTPAHDEIISRLIMQQTTGTGTPVNAVVTLVQGYKEFSSSFTQEKERGYADIQIQFVDAATGTPVIGCQSSGDYFVQSVDATTQKLEGVYQLTIRNVLYNCLKNISNQKNI